MMKKNLFCGFCLFLCAALLCGCQASSGSSPNSPGTTPQITLETVGNIIGEVTAPSVPENMPIYSESEFAQEHYITFSAKFDYMQSAEEFARSVTGKNSFAENFRAADFVEAYPILGSYLETTDLAAYLFYSNGKPVGIATLRFDIYGSVLESSPYADMTKKQGYVVALSNEACYQRILYCKENFPDFEIIGVAYSRKGFPAIYPVGVNAGSDHMQYVYTEPTDFKLVEPFATIEEGQKAFAVHRKEREDILSQLPIYSWQEAPFYETGYINAVDIRLTDEATASALGDYDSMIAIPLLNKKLEENVYILHLLYYRNRLIAELVIERRPKETGSVYVPVWQKVAEKDTHGQYIPIEQSQYALSCKQAALSNEAWNGYGVVFNDAFYPVGTVNDELMIYNTSLKSLEPIE